MTSAFENFEKELNEFLDFMFKVGQGTKESEHQIELNNEDLTMAKDFLDEMIELYAMSIMT